MQEFEIDLVDPQVRRDPYPSWARLREFDPVVRSRSLSPRRLTGPGPAAYLVHRFADVRRVLADPHHFSSAAVFRPPSSGDGGEGGGRAGTSPLIQALRADPESRALLDDPEVSANLRAGIFATTTMLSSDPPEHDRLRGVVSRAFFPRQVSALEGSIRELTQDLVRPLATGEHELMEALADPLPSIVIAEMLGIPRDDHGRFKEWSNAVIGSVDYEPEDPDADPLTRLRTTMLHPRRMALISEFRRYLAEQIERCRVERADNLISRMVAANEHDVLTDDELTAATFLLLIAGNETTTRLIANLALALDRNPDQRALLVDDPGLIPAAVEEALRYDPPVQLLTRMSIGENEVAGLTIPDRAGVVAVVAAANRDPQQFHDPDRFDVRRADAVNISFGYGAHFCLGAPLARREARIAFEELLKVIPSFRILTPADELDYRTAIGPTLRGPQRVRIAA